MTEDECPIKIKLLVTGRQIKEASNARLNLLKSFPSRFHEQIGKNGLSDDEYIAMFSVLYRNARDADSYAITIKEATILGI